MPKRKPLGRDAKHYGAYIETITVCGRTFKVLGYVRQVGPKFFTIDDHPNFGFVTRRISVQKLMKLLMTRRKRVTLFPCSCASVTFELISETHVRRDDCMGKIADFSVELSQMDGGIGRHVLSAT